MAPKPRSDWLGQLAQDPDLKGWYRNLANGAKPTADNYLRLLGAFCRDMNTDRADLVKLPETAVRDLLVSYVDRQVERGLARASIHSTIKAVRSWLLHHDRKLSLPVKVPLTAAPSRLDTEELPTPAQLRAVLVGATPTERLCCAFMAFSGLRPQALGNYLGNDGLRVSDLIGVKVQGGKVEIPEPPLRVRVRAMNSKAGHSYFTFLGEEGAEYLRASLEERARKGEALTPDSDVIHPYRAHKSFVRALNIGDNVRMALRRAGLTARPYVLRSYFASRLLEAQNAGKVAREYSEFWLGHTGDITAKHYTTGRARLPDSLIDSMREAYRRCEPYLSTVPTTARGGGNTEAFRVLLSAYYTDEEVAKIDLTDAAAVIEAIRKGASRAASMAGPKQQVIAETELAEYLDKGWLARMAVNRSKFVVERAT